MGKFRSWFFGIWMILGFLALIFIWVIYPMIESNRLNDFCLENNYDYGEYGQTIFQDSYCIKVVDNEMIKDEVDSCECGGGFCFVKTTKEVQGG